MDCSKSAWIWEIAKTATGIILIYLQGGWFQVNNYFPGADYLVAGYLVMSLITALYFSMEQQKGNKSSSVIS
jgi:hypothetical protein